MLTLLFVLSVAVAAAPTSLIGGTYINALPSQQRSLFIQSTSLTVHGVGQRFGEYYPRCAGTSGIVCFSPGFVLGLDRTLLDFERSFQPIARPNRVIEAPALDAKRRKWRSWSRLNRWVTHDLQVYQRLSVSSFADSAGLPAGYVHYGLGSAWRFGREGAHQLGWEFGPSIYIRESWQTLVWYTEDEDPFTNQSSSNFFTDSQVTVEDTDVTFMFPPALGLEYRYSIADLAQLHVTVVPLYLVNNVHVGLRFQL